MSQCPNIPYHNDAKNLFLAKYMPMNYAQAAQEENVNSAAISRSPSQSLLAHLSTSPFGWTTGSSRSTSPAPSSILSSTLRRVPSGSLNANGRKIGQPHQSLQSLVQSFINKVSRGTQTDSDDNDDQISIASMASGFSTFENNDYTRSRLKSFLNDPLYNEKNNIDEAEFVEELQKLRDQIDGRFKFSFDSLPPSQSISRQASRPHSRSSSRPPSRSRSPAVNEFANDLSRNLSQILKKTSRDQSIETDSCCLEDKNTQADFGPLSSNQQPQASSFFSFFSSNQPKTSISPNESFNVAIQTETEENVCSLCRQHIQNDINEIIENACQKKHNLLNSSQLLTKVKSSPDMNNNSIISPFNQKNETKSTDSSTQADLKGDSIDKIDFNEQTTEQGSNDDDAKSDKKEMIEPPMAVKSKSHLTAAAKTVIVGSGHFYRGENSIRNNSYSIINGSSSTNGVLKNSTSPKKNKMRIITSHDDDAKAKKMAKKDHVRPKCCSIS